MGLDASRDQVTIPSGSHRTAQALTRIIPALVSTALQSAGSILNASKAVHGDLDYVPLSYLLVTFVFRASKLG
jgi:hypothetical protein